MTTQTCIKCEKPYDAYWRGVIMPKRCRRCEYRYGEKAQEKARRSQRSLENAERRQTVNIRPKHVLGEAGTETWFHTQQVAFEQHMLRLGYPKTGPKPSETHSAAGDRPVAGLGARF